MNMVLGPFHCPFAFWRREDGRVADIFSFDTETTDIDDERPYLTPAYVLGAACDGKRGFFVGLDDLLPFVEAHRGADVIYHNAAFDLKVMQTAVGQSLDLYDAVEHNLVWDTLVLKRLLSLATAGHTARGESGLADCAREHLGVALQKDGVDDHGRKVRTSFSQFQDKPPQSIPNQYLTYLAHDVLATWHLFGDLFALIRDTLRSAGGVFGHGGDPWLRDVVDHFGPLTHHIQLRASILMDALRSTGIGIDQRRREGKSTQVRALSEEFRERLRGHRFLVDAKGNGKVLQSILDRFHREHPDVELKRSASGEKWSTAEEDLSELAHEDELFADYARYRQAEKLLSTYLSKMGPPRLYPRFGYLLATGRTYCGGGFNLQNLPKEKSKKEKEEKAADATIRGCFVPADGNVFIDSDYRQIELVVLGYALDKQLKLGPTLARLINEDNDVHCLIAAAVLGKAPQEVTDDERDSAKPVSFGRPGGMGLGGLRRVAKSGYGIDLTDEQVQRRIDAYHDLCPELTRFLADEVNAGEVIAAELQLTPARFAAAVGKPHDPLAPESHAPAGWVGWMLLKSLRDEAPRTDRGAGREYSAAELDFFWAEAQRLPIKLAAREQVKLQNRRADRKLWEAVRNWAGRRSVFTLTGRLRAKATFCSSRNTIFQGAAADGAILGLWLVWRAGYRIVDFIHDQLVVEVPDDGHIGERVLHIEALWKQGMLTVVPDMNVKVKTVVTRSLHKGDLVA
jgi:DNA polymerase I-like protein with 3'-5' exonuclease and polymerase domains